MFDEYTELQFAFRYPDVSAETAIQCIYFLFTIFWVPTNIHTDRVTAFISGHLNQLLM